MRGRRAALMSSPGAGRPRVREGLAALLAAALLALAAVRAAPLRPGSVLFGVDTASAQLPWAAALPPDAPRSAQNPALADQGMVFYPFYRWVARSWLAGDPPTWCPLIYAGA